MLPWVAIDVAEIYELVYRCRSFHPKPLIGTFQDAAPTYQNALRHRNFSHKLEYMPYRTQQSHRNRQRNIIWFNPPFSKNVETNIARNFLSLVDTHFPAGH